MVKKNLVLNFRNLPPRAPVQATVIWCLMQTVWDPHVIWLAVGWTIIILGWLFSFARMLTTAEIDIFEDYHARQERTKEELK